MVSEGCPTDPREEASGLDPEAVHSELIGAGLNDLDPFADSAEAVTAWENGAYESLLTHNVADIRRTRALMHLAEQYCSKSDFSMKSLEPVL